jgi:3'-5' exoribonuclease
VAGNTFIADIHDRDRVFGVFLVQQKQIPLNKNGKPYLAVVLMDRSGTIEARIWDNVEQYASQFNTGDFIELQGTALAYQGRVQLRVEKIHRISSESIDPEDFLPTSSRNRTDMLNRVRTLVASLSNQDLRALLLAHLDDPAFQETFILSPAAKTIHHAYLGGLLEHSLMVMELADRVCQLYPALDRDLLIAGALLHDIGKTSELEYERSFDYTDEGRLIGHLVGGAMMFKKWAEEQGRLPEELTLKLIHMILAHHGSYEFGSPKRPKFAEAMVLNYLDELDSKMQAMAAISQREAGQRWTSYQKFFDRYIFLGTQVSPGEEEEQPGSDATESAPPSSPEPKPAAAAPLKQHPFERFVSKQNEEDSIGQTGDLFERKPSPDSDES